jgi:hypothetical protein
LNSSIEARITSVAQPETAGELVGEGRLAGSVPAVDRDPQRVWGPSRREDRGETAEQRVTRQVLADAGLAAQGLTQRWTTSACPAPRCWRRA